VLSWWRAHHFSSSSSSLTLCLQQMNGVWGKKTHTCVLVACGAESRWYSDLADRACAVLLTRPETRTVHHAVCTEQRHHRKQHALLRPDFGEFATFTPFCPFAIRKLLSSGAVHLPRCPSGDNYHFPPAQRAQLVLLLCPTRPHNAASSSSWSTHARTHASAAVSSGVRLYGGYLEDYLSTLETIRCCVAIPACVYSQGQPSAPRLDLHFPALDVFLHHRTHKCPRSAPGQHTGAHATSSDCVEGDFWPGTA
jgi:hypothetical protein